MDRAGLPFVLSPAVGAALLGAIGFWWGAGALLLISGSLAFFFRDPDRFEPTEIGNTAVIAPADGRVLHAGDAEDGVAPEGQWVQISIFLSPLDVHVNRSPVGGHVVNVDYRIGKFLPAYDQRSAADNERCEVRVDNDGQVIIFRQVVGVLARRVVCRLRPGMEIARGQRFGIMKFGSRMDIFLPHSAEVLVTVGDVVRGGETVIGRLANKP